MTSQRKRLQSYLEERGLEAVSTGEAGVMKVRNLWGELGVSDLMDEVLQKENFDNAVHKVVANSGSYASRNQKFDIFAEVIHPEGVHQT